MENRELPLLLVEDTEADERLIRGLLATSEHVRFRIEHVQSLQAALEAVRTSDFCCALTDLSLPDSEELEVLSALQCAAPELPIVILSGRIEEDLAIRAVRDGAQDYLIKGHHDSLLLTRAIVYAIERKRAELERDESLRQREALLMEIHHRVKNNLQIISSLLSLQSQDVADPAVRAMFQDAQNRIFSMAYVHEELYRNEDLTQVHFGDYVRHLADHLVNSYGLDDRISVRIDVDEIELPIEKAVPCGLIMNELISNALKHAFPSGRSGNVTVELLKRVPDAVELLVRDDGIGFPAGVDVEQAKSLGMTIVQALSRQLNGTAEFAREDGTRARVVFPRGDGARDRTRTTRGVGPPDRRTKGRYIESPSKNRK